MFQYTEGNSTKKGKKICRLKNKAVAPTAVLRWHRYYNTPEPPTLTRASRRCCRLRRPARPGAPSRPKAAAGKAGTTGSVPRSRPPASTPAPRPATCRKIGITLATCATTKGRANSVLSGRRGTVSSARRSRAKTAAPSTAKSGASSLPVTQKSKKTGEYYTWLQPQGRVNVTRGYQGKFKTDVVPIADPFWKLGMCPVNVR